MVKFVGVIPKEDVKSVLTSPTVDGHFPLVIEPDDLIMMMALEDEFKLTRHQIKKKDQNAFLRNYQILSEDEVIKSLIVTKEEVMKMLPGIVTCVGCKRTLDNLFQTFTNGSSLGVLTFSSDGFVSISKDYKDESSLTNLLCNQVSRLSQDLSKQTSEATDKKRGGRCDIHRLELSESKVTMTTPSELGLYKMEKECRDATLLLPYESIKARFAKLAEAVCRCSNCIKLLNIGHDLLKKGFEFRGVSLSAVSGYVRLDAEKGYIDICRIISTVVKEVLKDMDTYLVKGHITLELVQRMLLIDAGSAWADRLERIKLKRLETGKACDLLFLAILMSLRQKLVLAAEKKRGISDLELLCQEFDKDDKLKEEKREKKRHKKALKKNSNTPKHISADDIEPQATVESLKEVVHNAETERVIPILRKDSRTLKEMLENGFEDQDDHYEIPQDDIKSYFQNRHEIALKRKLLREHLKQKFAQLCLQT